MKKLLQRIFRRKPQPPFVQLYEVVEFPSGNFGARCGNGQMSAPVILSLFDYSGAWSQPYVDAGYDVHRFDIKRGADVLAWDFSRKYDNVRGILAAPPCTDMAVSGAQYWPAKDADGRTAHTVRLFLQTLRIVDHYAPRWWALENPVGRVNKLVPRLAAFGPWYFQPWWFGDAYTKKTGLWGTFSRDLVRNDVEPVRVSAQGSWVQRLGGSSERTKELRSVTPPGFARAFFNANP